MSRSNSSTFIDDAIRFPRETHAALREFARSKPWRGTRAHRIKKFRAVHAKLCKIYSVDTRLKIVGGEDRTSSASFYRRRDNSVVLVGRLSVVTYLQMFAGSLDCDREQMIKWSVNLFKRRFPLSFSRCKFVGHMLVRKTEVDNYRARRGWVEFLRTQAPETTGEQQ